MKNLLKTTTSLLVLTPLILSANHSFSHEDETTTLIRPDSHAPIGVMGDHMHKAGEWMLGYRLAKVDMKGLLDGTQKITPDDIATMDNPNGSPPSFRFAPESMEGAMHMLGAMYAPSDRITLILGGSVVRKEMLGTTYKGMMGTNTLGQTTMVTSSFNGLKAVALVRLYEKEGNHLHAGVGVVAPFGSIDETGDMLTPTGMTMTSTLAYPMQTGSGTWDFLPNITYTKLGDFFSGGVQYSGRLPIGQNNAGYSFGNQHSFNGWVSALVDERFSLSVRLNYEVSGQIEGADARISGPSPASIPAMMGRKGLNMGFGINYVFQNGPLKGHRLAGEFVNPLIEETNGPQLEKNYKFILGWQYAF